MEMRLRGLGLAEWLGDSVAPDALPFTALSSCDSSRTWWTLGGGEVVSVAFKVEADKPDFAQRRSVWRGIVFV
jgi:hypothetical protein